MYIYNYEVNMQIIICATNHKEKNELLVNVFLNKIGSKAIFSQLVCRKMM